MAPNPDPSADLRHHAARRRAVARLQHDSAREAASRTRARRARRRCHRGGLSRRLARRLGSGATRWRARCRARSSAAWRAATARTSSWPRKALQDAPSHRIHVFLATSAIHRQYKLNMAQEEILRTAVEGVQIARELCEDVEFSPEDASRTELEFLAQVVEAAIEAGATTVNIPDTVGYTVPDEFAELFRYLRKNVRGIDSIRLSVHCHDDLGMAVANSLTAVVAGARQVECTINGIGERAGNCSLEEVVMALKTREAFFNVTHRHPDQPPLSHLAAGLEHHRHADPAQQGGRRRERLRARGRHPSARHAASITPPTRSCGPRTSACRAAISCSASTAAGTPSAIACKELGFELDELEFNRVFEEFKALADKKKELFDGDIEALVLRAEGSASGPWSLLRSADGRATCNAPAEAIVRLQHADGRTVERKAHGRRTGRCRVQGDRGGDRHQRRCCASSRCAASPRARTRRARRSCTSSTISAPTAARASAPTSSSPAPRRFSKSSTASSSRRRARRCARGAHRRGARGAGRGLKS